MMNQPIFFERNRVFRVYKGGKLFADFFGDLPEDGNYPEEWVASCVKALNRNPASQQEGVSKLIGTDMYFDTFLSTYKKELLGDKQELGVLVKLLDSAIRLPAQAHPDRAFSQQYFQSTHGKAESWLILATRPGAKIYFGFQEGVSKERFIQAIQDSETDKTAMERLMCEIPVQPGDVFFIPAKQVHAIGAGCLLLEVQEPTDYTIQPEHWCGDYHLSDHEMYLGLDFEAAMKCFDFQPTKPVKKQPQLIEQGEGYQYEKLIGEEDTSCFRVNQISLNGGSFTLQNGPAVYVIIDGSGTICGGKYQRQVQKGDYFFLPYCANGQFTVAGNGLKVVECFS